MKLLINLLLLFASNQVWMVGGGNGERPRWTAVAGSGGGEPPQLPTITLPPRGGGSSMESLFNGGFSPGPMTLVSSLFADGGDDCKSFSQLLAGAMASPAAAGYTGLVDSPSAFFSPSQVKAYVILVLCLHAFPLMEYGFFLFFVLFGLWKLCS